MGMSHLRVVNMDVTDQAYTFQKASVKMTAADCDYSWRSRLWMCSEFLWSSSGNVTTSEQCNVTTSKQCNVTTSEQCNVTTSEQCNVTTSEQCNVTTSEQCNVTTSKQCNVTTSEQCNVTTSEQCNVTTSEQCNVTTSEQCNVTQFHWSVYWINKFDMCPVYMHKPNFNHLTFRHRVSSI